MFSVCSGSPVKSPRNSKSNIIRPFSKKEKKIQERNSVTVWSRRLMKGSKFPSGQDWAKFKRNNSAKGLKFCSLMKNKKIKTCTNF